MAINDTVLSMCRKKNALSLEIFAKYLVSYVSTGMDCFEVLMIMKLLYWLFSGVAKPTKTLSPFASSSIRFNCSATIKTESHAVIQGYYSESILKVSLMV